MKLGDKVFKEEMSKLEQMVGMNNRNAFIHSFEKIVKEYEGMVSTTVMQESYSRFWDYMYLNKIHYGGNK